MASRRCTATPWSSQNRSNHSMASRLPSRYAEATRCDWYFSSREYLVPCSSDTFAVVFPVVTAPTSRASTTATRRPARASRSAVVRPVMPAPTTRSSTGPSGSGSLGTVWAWSSHRDVIARPVPTRGRHMPGAGVEVGDCGYEAAVCPREETRDAEQVIERQEREAVREAQGQGHVQAACREDRQLA